MVTIKDIADDGKNVSCTRWGFAITLIFDVVAIGVVITAGIVGYFVGLPIPIDFFNSVALLLGVLTGITGTTKALQGFEPYKYKKDYGEKNEKQL